MLVRDLARDLEPGKTWPETWLGPGHDLAWLLARNLELEEKMTRPHISLILVQFGDLASEVRIACRLPDR